MSSSLSPGDPRRYRRRARGVVFLAGLCLISGLTGLTGTGSSVSMLRQELADVAELVWLSLYAGGGALVLVGVYWPRLPRPELELLGLWPLMGGFTINVLVVLALRGPIPDGPTMTQLTALLLAVWVAHGRTLDLEGAGADAGAAPGPGVEQERRAYDLGPRARAGARIHRDERRAP
jgi:hypothetical protein